MRKIIGGVFLSLDGVMQAPGESFAARDVQHLTRDAYGLPRLDDVFLAVE